MTIFLHRTEHTLSNQGKISFVIAAMKTSFFKIYNIENFLKIKLSSGYTDIAFGEPHYVVLECNNR